MSVEWYPVDVDKAKPWAPDPVIVDRESKEPRPCFKPEHVVTKTVDGAVKSRFKDDKWDFTSQTASNKNKVSFKRIKSEALKSEAKELALYLWHLSGRAFNSFQTDSRTLLNICMHCEDSGCSLKEALASPSFLDDCLVASGKAEVLGSVSTMKTFLYAVELCRHRVGDGFPYTVSPALKVKIEARRPLYEAREEFRPRYPSRIYSAFTDLGLKEVEQGLGLVDALEALYKMRAEYRRRYLAKKAPHREWLSLTVDEKHGVTKAFEKWTRNPKQKHLKELWIPLNQSTGSSISDFTDTNNLIVHTSSYVCCSDCAVHGHAH